MQWKCPVCGEALTLKGSTWQCVNRHSFDRAREGYVNLLSGHRRHSRAPGDDRAMLQARRAFLEQGHYRPLRDRLVAICAEQAAEWTDFRLLDAGCGEGYYSGHIATHLGREIAAIDIARDAARMAAKRYSLLQVAVASAADLPLSDASLHGILRVFAPGYPDEVVRTLMPGGCYLTVTPAADHLFALRARVYDHPRPHQDAVESLPGLTHRWRETLDFAIHPRGEDVARLFRMTPYYWRTDRQRQAEITALPVLDTRAAFHIDCYRKLP